MDRNDNQTDTFPRYGWSWQFPEGLRLLFFGAPPRWYFVRPSRRNSKASSGESTIFELVEVFRGDGAGVDEGLEVEDAFQYSLP